jgi:hypothetical protein
MIYVTERLNCSTDLIYLHFVKLEFAAFGDNLPVVPWTATYRQDRALTASFAFPELAHDTHHR